MIALVAALVGCARPLTPPIPEVSVAGPGFLHVRGAGYQGVIAESGDWTPSPADIAQVEAALGPALAAHALGAAHEPATFVRQYQGTTIGGVKRVQIWLSCDAPPGWEAEGLPATKGGGACYGRADYELATGRIVDLAANGPR